MATRIHRVTLFKVPDPENQKKLLEAYEVLKRDQKKDGKPYILQLTAGRTADPDDARAKGYTVVAKSEFATLEDLRFYDNECEAHATLRRTAAGLGLVEKPLVVYFEA